MEFNYENFSKDICARLSEFDEFAKQVKVDVNDIEKEPILYDRSMFTEVVEEPTKVNLREATKVLNTLNNVPKWFVKPTKKPKAFSRLNSSDKSGSNSMLSLPLSDSISSLSASTDDSYARLQKAKLQYESLLNQDVPQLQTHIRNYIAEMKDLQKVVGDLKRATPKVNDFVDAFNAEEKKKIEQLSKELDAFIAILESKNMYASNHSERDNELEFMMTMLNDLVQNIPFS